MDLKYVLISVVFAGIITAIFYMLKKAVIVKLSSLLLEKKYKEFNIFLNSKFVKFFISKIDIINYQLSSSFLRNDVKEIEKTFTEIEKLSIPDSILDKLNMQAFNYYVSIKNENKVSYYLEKINKSKNNQLKQEANIVYDVYIVKGSKYLDFLLDRINMQEEIYNGADEYLISLIYENMNDLENAKKYFDLASKHMQLLDENLKNKKKR